MEIGDKIGGFPAHKVFEQEKRDVNNESLRTARELGSVRLNHSRLNLFTSLAAGDKEDNYSFKVMSKGNLRIGLYGEDNVRIQVLNGRGRAIADSKEGTGRLYEKFQGLLDQEGTSFDPGSYYLKVTRANANDTKTELPYSIQLQMGDTYKNDYDTKEYEAKVAKTGVIFDDPAANATQNSATLQGKGIATMLSDGLIYLNQMMDKTINIFSTLMK